MANLTDAIRVAEAPSQLGLFRKFFGTVGDESFFRGILDALPAAVYTTNATGQITRNNRYPMTISRKVQRVTR